MSGGEVAGILVAVFWAILVSFLAVALFRLARALRAAADLMARVSEEAVPLLVGASATVRSANAQLARVDAIAADVQEVSANASALSTTVSTAFGGPLVKVAAFGYGVRRALGRTGSAEGGEHTGEHAGARTGAAERKTVVGRTVGRTARGGVPDPRRGIARRRKG